MTFADLLGLFASLFTLIHPTLVLAGPIISSIFKYLRGSLTPLSTKVGEQVTISKDRLESLERAEEALSIFLRASSEIAKLRSPVAQKTGE